MGRNRIETLSKLQIGRIRANMSRRATQIGNRIQAAALGEIEMTPAQLKAAALVLQHTLPSQSQQEIEDITQDRPDPKETQQKLSALMRDDLIAKLTRAGLDKKIAAKIADGQASFPESIDE